MVAVPRIESTAGSEAEPRDPDRRKEQDRFQQPLWLGSP